MKPNGTTARVLNRLMNFGQATTTELSIALGIRGTAVSSSLALGMRDGLVEREERPGSFARYKLTADGVRRVRRVKEMR